MPCSPRFQLPSRRIGFNVSTPAKSLSLPVTTTQAFASAVAAMMVSSALRGRPCALPSAISRAQAWAAFSSKGNTRPANSAPSASLGTGYAAYRRVAWSPGNQSLPYMPNFA